MRKPDFHKKAFLNLDGYHSTACIFTKVKGEEVEIKIRDCNGSITLTQELDTVGGIENAIYKASTLAKHCLEVVAFLEGVLQEKKQATTKKLPLSF
ncbi:MAG TPA: hypothetical protein PKH93_09390 [Chitinophagales bacterium]|nr:hypothetical protein [Chitinophagales bacterium]